MQYGDERETHYLDELISNFAYNFWVLLENGADSPLVDWEEQEEVYAELALDYLYETDPLMGLQEYRRQHVLLLLDLAHEYVYMKTKIIEH